MFLQHAIQTFKKMFNLYIYSFIYLFIHLFIYLFILKKLEFHNRIIDPGEIKTGTSSIPRPMNIYTVHFSG